MTETLTEKTRRTLNEAYSFLSQDEAQHLQKAVEKIIEAHTFLSEINNIKRTNSDFKDAQEMYKRRIPEIDVVLLGHNIDLDNHYRHILCSSEQR